MKLYEISSKFTRGQELEAALKRQEKMRSDYRRLGCFRNE